MRKRYDLSLIFLIVLLCTYSAFAQNWGTIRYVHSTVNVRSNRSTNSRIIARLKTGQKIRADFLKDNWFAVFAIDEAIRAESRAIGYVYAPLLKPNPPSKTTATMSDLGILKYQVVKRKDISYLGNPRMAFRVILRVSRIPTEEQMKRTAIHIWQKGNKRYKVFTTFLYLPDMDTSGFAYAVAEFTPHGMKEFTTQKEALYGTKWEQ